MIRTVASSLRRGAVAAAQGEQRRLASHPPLPLLQRFAASAALPCRGFHGGAIISGEPLLRTAVPPPSANVPSLSRISMAAPHYFTTANHTRMYSTKKSPIEEKTEELLQLLLDDEAAAAAERKSKEEEEMKAKLAEKLEAEKKAKVDELFALISSQQAASGVAQDKDAVRQAIVLARLARDGQEIAKLKEAQVFGAVAYLMLAILVVSNAIGN